MEKHPADAGHSVEDPLSEQSNIVLEDSTTKDDTLAEGIVLHCSLLCIFVFLLDSDGDDVCLRIHEGPTVPLEKIEVIDTSVASTTSTGLDLLSPPSDEMCHDLFERTLTNPFSPLSAPAVGDDGASKIVAESFAPPNDVETIEPASGAVGDHSSADNDRGRGESIGASDSDSRSGVVVGGDTGSASVSTKKGLKRFADPDTPIYPKRLKIPKLQGELDEYKKDKEKVDSLLGHLS